MSSTIGWLHLSDLHQGLADQAWMWPSVRDAFFDDLQRLHDKAGPWDLVLFTGDLTQKGTTGEFDRLTETLAQLFRHLEGLGSKPFLVAVPGNHDLVRPSPSRAVVKAMRDWERDPDLRKDLVADVANEHRQLIQEVFAPFEAWLDAWTRAHPPPAGSVVKRGTLPGDRSILFETRGLRLGVVGLNSAFLQLEKRDYERHLALDPRQILAVCDGDPSEWARSADVALLLTHHPLAWFHSQAQEDFREHIAPPGRFLAHLFGHMHEPTAQFQRVAGAATERRIQAASLFGLETWGDGKHQRIHGYSAGRIDVDGTAGTLRIWPRMLQKQQAGHRRMVADSSWSLDAEDAVVEPFALRAPPRAAGAVPDRDGPASGEALEAEVARYRQAVAADRARGLSLWGDLGEGPEAAGDQDLLKRFVVPKVEAVGAPAAASSADPFVPPIAEPMPPDREGEARLEKPIVRFPEPADQMLFDAARPWALVLGGPGAGKSVLAEWLLLTLCVPGEAPADLIPVRITLRHVTRRFQEDWRHEDFFEHLDAEHAQLGVALGAAELRTLAERGRIFWIFDGLDEVEGEDARARVATKIARIKSRCGGRGLITSRVFGSARARQILQNHGISSYRLLDFDDDQIRDWIERWHAAVATHALAAAAARRRDRLKRALRDSPSVREMCRTPLLLTLVAGLSHTGDVPTRRAELYARVLENRADEWEARKELEDGASSRFDYRTKERFLRELAWKMMTELPGGSSNVVTGQDLTAFAARFCETALDEPIAVAQRTARALVAHLRERHEVLVFHGDDRFGFAHRALLDYLAAGEVLERVTRGTWGRRYVEALFRKRWQMPEWRECLTLLAGQLADRRPELAVQMLQAILGDLPLFEQNDVEFVSFCMHSLADIEALDGDPMRFFALRLTELAKHCPLYLIKNYRPVGVEPRLVSDLRIAGERWPGAPILRAWAVDVRDSGAAAIDRSIAYQLGMATAPRADRLPLLRELLSGETDAGAFASAIREAGRRAPWMPDELEAILALAAERGERSEVAASVVLVLQGEGAVIGRLLALMRSAKDARARVDAASFLARVNSWGLIQVRGEALRVLPSLVESCPGLERVIAASELEEELSADASLTQRVRGWLGSQDEGLREVAEGLLAKMGDPGVIASLEERVRTLARNVAWREISALESASERAKPAFDAIARILADRRVADVETLIALARWWAARGSPIEAREALSSAAQGETSEAVRVGLGSALIDIHGGEAEGRSLLLPLARMGLTSEIRAKALDGLKWWRVPMEQEVVLAARDLARSATHPEIRVTAAIRLAEQPDAELRREGVRLLREIARSDVPDTARLYAAVNLHLTGDPTGTEVLTELAEMAASASTRLDAARRLSSEAAIQAVAESADDDAVRAQAEHSLALLKARRRVLEVGRLRRGLVALNGSRVGIIEEIPGGTRFTYDPAWLAQPSPRPISPSMPPRSAPYESEGLLPFFENLLPEGWLLDISRRKLGVAANDPFGLLLATCGDCIGAVEITPAPEEQAA